LVGAGGFLYVESARAVEALPVGFERWRSDRAGAVCFELLRRNSSG
jgi:hypothetical protein